METESIENDENTIETDDVELVYDDNHLRAGPVSALSTSFYNILAESGKTRPINIGRCYGKKLLKFVKTPKGFFVTLYLLNVVGWGALLFFLLMNWAPEFNKPDATSPDSQRFIWLEYTSQIMNTLFCIACFGTIPWRFRDLYHLLAWRVTGSAKELHKLSEIHYSWFRLPPSEDKEFGFYKSTDRYKLDVVIWLYVLNSLNQGVLSYFMWAYGRKTRPTWSTPIFVVLGCTFGCVAGIITGVESNRIKKQMIRDNNTTTANPTNQNAAPDLEKGLSLKKLNLKNKIAEIGTKRGTDRSPTAGRSYTPPSTKKVGKGHGGVEGTVCSPITNNRMIQSEPLV